MKPSFRERMEIALNSYFPKYKCKERSSALMLFSTALVENEKEMQKVELHLGYLLGEVSTMSEPATEARAYFEQLKAESKR